MWTKKPTNIRQTQHLLFKTIIAATCFGSYLAILELYKILQKENIRLRNVTKTEILLQVQLLSS
jgi:hypothetical protein